MTYDNTTIRQHNYMTKKIYDNITIRQYNYVTT